MSSILQQIQPLGLAEIYLRGQANKRADRGLELQEAQIDAAGAQQQAAAQDKESKRVANVRRFAAESLKRNPGAAPEIANMLLSQKAAEGITLPGQDLNPGDIQRMVTDLDASSSGILGAPRSQARQLPSDEFSKAVELGYGLRLDTPEGRSKYLELRGKAAQPDKLKATLDLKKMYEGHATVQRTHQVAESVRKMFAIGESGVSDLNLMFGFMKAMDPGSRVTEGELRVSEGAGGALQRLANSWNKAKKGRLFNDTVRGEFMDEIQRLWTAQMDAYSPIAKSFRDMATNHNLNVSEVVAPLGFEKIKAPKPKQTAAGKVMSRLNAMAQAYIDQGKSVEEAKRMAEADWKAGKR